MLRREGIVLNHKKLYRLYREERLTVRKRGGRKRALGTRAPMAIPQGPNQRWSLDFVSDALASSRRFRILTVVDDFSRECLALVVDNSGDVGIASWLDGRAAERLRVIRLDPPLGFGAAVNAGIEAAAGEVCVLFDQSVELKGDAITPLLTELDDPSVAVAGPFGVRAKGTLKEFDESAGPDADAVEGYCMAFRRADALAAGGFDPKFRFYRIADIEFSFRLRDRGGRAVVVPDLLVVKHEHRLWEATEPAERDRLSRRNLYRFLDRWRDRTDLMAGETQPPQ